MRALTVWLSAAAIAAGPVFRRVGRRYKAKAAVRGRRLESISGREAWDLRKTLSKPAVPERVLYDIGTAALHPGSIGPLYRAMTQRAFDAGRVESGFVCEWRGHRRHHGRAALEKPTHPLAYNRDLAAEAGAAGRLLRKLE